MTSAIPRVSLGVPVYNGENYLAQMLECIVGQTFGDFELIVSDNASTDNTEAICRDFAARDARVRYERTEQNVGVSRNFNRALSFARGEYYQWLAHDDLVAPTMLERCVGALDANHEAVLAMPRVGVIDGQNRQVLNDEFRGEILTDEVFLQRWQLLGSSKAAERYLGLLIYSRRCYELFGLIRTDALRRTGLYRQHANAEKVMLSELSLLGPWVQVPETLFFSRWHEERYSNNKSLEKQVGYVDPQSKRKRVWPHQPRCAAGYFLAPWRMNVPLSERLACMGAFSRFVLQVNRWPDIARKALRGTGMTVSIPKGASRGTQSVVRSVDSSHPQLQVSTSELT